MAYTSNLTTGEQLQIENQGTQTVIILSKGGLNQQQSQRTSFQTGGWLQPPTLFRTTTAVVLRIEATQGQFFIQLHSGSINVLGNAPSLIGADILPLQQVAASSMNEMPPMQPMEPMQMGMQPVPMQMRMGNMQLLFGVTESTSFGNRFCSQCGGEVKQGDRFCSHCGERLN